MSWRHPIRSLLLATILGATAAGAEPAPAVEPPAAGIDAIAAFQQALGSTLKAALADGPIPAIDACRSEAPRIAAERTAAGIAVGRTSQKLRNPGNAPEPWMQPLLDAYQRGELDGPHAVALGERGTGVVQPIRVQPLCTTCHGATIAPDLRDHLRERYPDDRATGYAVGDFRGLFWAVVPPAAD